MNDKEVKILAYYLPQFHEIPENNKWWGKGFTEWVNVKKAIPLFDGHKQPRIPLNDNYYDLNNIEVMRWQANLARNNGMYGFCFYHYWFDDKPLLEKPLINYLNADDIHFPYCFCCANESWTNGWAKADSSIIMEQKYGSEMEWKKHFEFMLPFFNDERYIKENNMPLLVIYRPYLFNNMQKMLEYWKELAKEKGFSGLKIASQRFEEPQQYKNLYDYLDYHILYEPRNPVRVKNISDKTNLSKVVRSKIHDFLYKKFNVDLSFHQKKNGPVLYDYDDMWNIILQRQHDEKTIAGAFVNWDNTPRHARRGSVYVGASPEKFEYYMKKQIRNVKENYNNKYLFLFAWNEWGEGGILEPDKENGFDYLNAIKKALECEKNANIV